MKVAFSFALGSQHFRKLLKDNIVYENYCYQKYQENFVSLTLTGVPRSIFANVAEILLENINLDSRAADGQSCNCSLSPNISIENI